MAKRKKQLEQEPETHQYTIEARWEFRGTATVEATSEDEAMAKFNALDGVDFNDSGAELINWEADGSPKVDA